jgi:hypothetical protein
MDARLKRYYRKKMNGGRSIIARAADFIMLRAAMLVTLFIVMLQWSHSLAVSISVAVLITVAISLSVYLYRRKKAEKYFEKDMQRIREKCLLETLTLMNLNEYIDFMGRIFPEMEHAQPVSEGFLADYKGVRMVVLHNHPSSGLSVSQAVDAYRLGKGAGKIALVSVSEFSAEAKKFAESVSMILVPGKEILRIADEKGLLIDRNGAEERAQQEMEETLVSLESVRRSAFSRTKVKAYIFCGLVSLIWPIFGIWRIYYPIISILCFALAFISFKKGKHAQESAGIDLT